jgi:type III secretion protein L
MLESPNIEQRHGERMPFANDIQDGRSSQPVQGATAADEHSVWGTIHKGGVAIYERKQFTRALVAQVVPAEAWANLAELDTALAHVNALHLAADAEISKARDRGYAEGFDEGLARAEQQMARQLADLNEQRARVLAEASARISELACAIVMRIAPQFDPTQLVPPMVQQAVESAQAEQFLMIRVHPNLREHVAAGLGAIKQAHPGVGVIELVDDESLDPQSCIVVSEAGEVRASIAQQIEAIRLALADAAATGYL